MNRREYLNTRKRLMNGETLSWTPEQAAEYVQAETRERIHDGVMAARSEPQPLTAETVERLLVRYGGNWGVWPLFVEIVRGCTLTPAAFSSGLTTAYTMGHADRETALLLFEWADPSQMMNADDLAVFRTLPDPLTIYRGCDMAEYERDIFGLSWSTDPAVAEFFAWRFNPDDTERVVVRTTIHPEQVLAYFNERNEREVITDIQRPNTPVEVNAWEPTAAFRQRHADGQRLFPDGGK